MYFFGCSVRGTKKAITAAKAAILAISETVGEEITTTVEIDNEVCSFLFKLDGLGT